MTDLTVIDAHAERSATIWDPRAIAAQPRPIARMGGTPPIADVRFTAAAMTRGRR
ncbi:hypothetical protein AB0K60_22055 [Thermopolyspora sp. NPDC052614]|uniref:hypothetical protein n=1 Tax=Thermopolyspora sp. NPDC052614 TaxID=3155682 RepID=UPI00343F969E